MRYCRRCVMPDTRPGVVLDADGVCNGCRHAEYKKTVDWISREKQFQQLCDKYRRKGNEYDCVIAVSSGKDSYYQIHMMKNKYNMNPLCVNVDNSDWTQTGISNFENMLDVFNVDCVQLKLNKTLNRKISRIGFEHDGFLFWLFDRCIYTFPVQVAIKYGIPLIVYGEDVSVEYGGYQKVETSSAKEQINNNVAKDYGWDVWRNNGIDLDNLNMARYPSVEEINNANLNPIYLSYFFNWSGFEHMKLAKKLYSWKSLNDTGEWKRQGYIEDYDQIDDFAYLVDPWMKYPKYGHARTTDVCCYWIRDGRISREQAVEWVKHNDSVLDPVALEHYLSFSGYTTNEFWEIVDEFYNKKIFEKKQGTYRLRNPIWR